MDTSTVALPVDWRSLPFEACATQAGVERRPSVQQGDYKQVGRFPVVDQGGGLVAGYTDEEQFVHRADLPLILFGDHTRVFKFLDFPFATGADGTKLLRANDDLVAPRFLYYALLHQEIPSRGYSRHFKYLKDKRIRIPLDRDEQQAIAATLSKIHVAVDVQERIVAALRELKAVTMAKLFREGLRGEPLQQTEIGEIPESWNVVRVRELVTLGSGQSRPREMSPSREESKPFPVYGGNGVMGYSDQFLTATEAIVIGRVGAYCGSVYVCPPQSWVTDNALYHRDPVSQRASLHFLAELLAHLKLNRLHRQGAQPLITQGSIQALGIPLPKLPEQEAIASIARRLDERIAAAGEELGTLNAVFSSMLHMLMTGQVRAKGLLLRGARAEQFARAKRECARPDDGRRNGHTGADLEVRRCQVDPAVLRLDQDVGQDRQGLPRLHDVLEQLERPEERLAGDLGQAGSDRARELLEKIECFVSELVRRFEPERVILFGRPAEGSPGAGGKVGLLVVVDFEGRALAEAVRIEREIEHSFALEVMVRRPEEIRRALESGNPLIKRIVEEGNVLYVRPDAEVSVAADVGLHEQARRATPKGKLSDETLREIVRRVVEAVAPEKIILFGSAARGEMGPDSDVDLLVVKSGVDRLETARAVRRSLLGIGMPKDVIAVTPEDLSRYGGDRSRVIFSALREGKVVYAA